MQHTPLYDAHLRLGAKMVDFGGWAMPVSYPGGILDEHSVPRLRCRIVAGAANNQLADDRGADLLGAHGSRARQDEGPALAAARVDDVSIEERNATRRADPVVRRNRNQHTRRTR